MILALTLISETFPSCRWSISCKPQSAPLVFSRNRPFALNTYPYVHWVGSRREYITRVNDANLNTNMRLLNTKTLEFEEFFNPPEYAILSHRWGPSEVTFEQYQTGTNIEGQGYDKITQSCKFAQSRGRKYIWIDTCCIDKRSSSELSEAINSMWSWYADAKECYAYLSDVTTPPPDRPLNSGNHKPSKWFSRGWTLQELLAPRVIVFCNSDWDIIGLKQDPALLAEISNITSIPQGCLSSHFSLNNACVAQKLSWAARRVTTRKEDMAYCLLGLLGINMPLLYGEGTKAFLRLQQEIIRQTDDESIFAWRYAAPPVGYISGVLAPGVQFFAHSGDVRLIDAHREPYTVTNKGLDLRVSCIHVKETETYIIPLNCQYGGTADSKPLHRCHIAVRRERKLFSRTDVEGLGRHLFQVYPPILHQMLEQRFLIRLMRWQNEYEPANVIIKAFIERLRERRQKRFLV